MGKIYLVPIKVISFRYDFKCIINCVCTYVYMNIY